MSSATSGFSAHGLDADASSWSKEAWRWGIGGFVGVAMFVTTWMGLVLPMRDYQKKMMDDLAAANMKNAETQEKNAVTLAQMQEARRQEVENQRQQTALLERISRGQDESVRFQQQLLEATKRGAWLDK